MNHYDISKDLAERYAAALTAERMNAYAFGNRGEPADSNRIVTGYRVERYAGGRWGVVERWRYAGRPDLGEFGGAFIHIDTLRHAAGF